MGQCFQQHVQSSSPVMAGLVKSHCKISSLGHKHPKSLYEFANVVWIWNTPVPFIQSVSNVVWCRAQIWHQWVVQPSLALFGLHGQNKGWSDGQKGRRDGSSSGGLAQGCYSSSTIPEGSHSWERSRRTDFSVGFWDSMVLQLVVNPGEWLDRYIRRYRSRLYRYDRYD